MRERERYQRKQDPSGPFSRKAFCSGNFTRRRTGNYRRGTKSRSITRTK